MGMKKAVGITAVITAALGLWLGYHLGYSDGESKGFADGEWDAMNHKSDAPAPKKHHQYSFKQNGATILRFDSVTGESCWVQLSVADKDSQLPSCDGLDSLRGDDQ
jgi:hypothetical protein